MLQDLGVSTAQKGEQADICLINTCSVTEVADKKCRQAIHRLVRENPGAFVVVTGCYAQLEADEVAKIEGVSLVLGSNEKANLVQFLSDAWTGAPTAKYYREKTKDIKSFVSRNPTIASLVAQAQEAAAEGGKEIVLTGVNIGDFGKTTGEKFIDLVKALDGVEGIQRYRISSLEPDLISDELIEYCAKSRAFMPHFHIPLQSGSNTVLKLMHRHYDRELFAEKIHRIKELMPDAFIGVDVMVGCRGETPECFEETYTFLDSLDVTQLHVFPYSERPGTSALSIPYVVPEKEKKQRVKRLLELSDQKTHAFYERYIGQQAEVLFEKATRGRAMHGFTKNYIRVELPAKDANPDFDNQLISVKLGEMSRDKESLMCII